MIERDDWVQIRALTADRARRFFGKPKSWPVREVPNSYDEIDGRRLFEVARVIPVDDDAFEEPTVGNRVI